METFGLLVHNPRDKRNGEIKVVNGIPRVICLYRTRNGRSRGKLIESTCLDAQVHLPPGA